MLVLRFFRGETSPQGTFSDVTVEEENGRVLYRCKGAELPWRDNKQSVSCIPSGRYPMARFFSPSHNADVWHFCNVSGRTVVELHAGNLAGDANLGYASDVEGCGLPGAEVKTFGAGERVGRHVLDRPQKGVTSSKTTLAALEALLGAGPCRAVFEWAPGVGPTA